MRQISGMHLPTGRAALAVAVVLTLALAAAPSMQAQTFTVLYSFKGAPDGFNPHAGLMFAGGYLYGTTVEGGLFGSGTVFRVNGQGRETTLHSFAAGTSGSYAGLVRNQAGKFYGTTVGGGAFNQGSVFQLDAAGNENVVYSFGFNGATDGQEPYDRLIFDTQGNLYGTTFGGGDSNYGTVFKLDALGIETVLYSFKGGADGEFPIYGSLAMDATGNLYGDTLQGGTDGEGTVFKVDTAGNESVLHTFTGSDGASPVGGVAIDPQGNLYGTTAGGGTGCCGVVFKLDTSGNETVLHSFAGTPDGGNPYASLVMDGKGNLFGTTSGGGTFNGGTVFEVTRTGKEIVLHSFNDATDGGFPYAGLVVDEKGNLYGTAANYGAPGLFGTVFKITP